MPSSVMPCKGSLGGEAGDVISKFSLGASLRLVSHGCWANLRPGVHARFDHLTTARSNYLCLHLLASGTTIPTPTVAWKAGVFMLSRDGVPGPPLAARRGMETSLTHAWLQPP